MLMVASKLKQLRQGLQPSVTQEDLAIHAGVRLKTYRNAEQGRNTSYTTATAILKALNDIRVRQGLASLVLEDLGLSIV